MIDLGKKGILHQRIPRGPSSRSNFSPEPVASEYIGMEAPCYRCLRSRKNSISCGEHEREGFQSRAACAVRATGYEGCVSSRTKNTFPHELYTVFCLVSLLFRCANGNEQKENKKTKRRDTTVDSFLLLCVRHSLILYIRASPESFVQRSRLIDQKKKYIYISRFYFFIFLSLRQ